jgi:hypothetical protein
MYSKYCLDIKEKELQDKLDFFKENIEQLVRIKCLEGEIEDVKEKIENEYKKCQQTKKDEKRSSELIKLCKENCQKAYEKYMYEKLQADMIKSKRDITISLDVVLREYIRGMPGISPLHLENRLIFHYKFDILDEKRYDVVCEINLSHFKIKGIYDIDNGFSVC